MIILPAIDLKDNKVVRLYKGEFDTVHQVADDPVATAKAFYEAGARYIHMVDLDGAKDGVRKNADIVRAVAESVGLKVELGGGIRSMSDLEDVRRAHRRGHRHQERKGQDCRLDRGLRSGLSGLCPSNAGYWCKDDYLYRH